MIDSPLTRRAILAQAWPIMLGQATVPLVGIVDTAVIGRTGDAVALAGVALGVTIINFLFWTFGFLRMGMTGMTAQAHGRGDGGEADAMLLRGLALGFGCGLVVLAGQVVLILAAFALMAGGGDMDVAGKAYAGARFLGAPALLSVYAVNGWLLGLGRTRAALMLQLVLNLVNIALCALFVWEWHMGPRGVGLATACAEWTAFAASLVLIARHLKPRPGLFDGAAMKRLVAVNADIMLRTIALLAMFAWFTNAGARLGPQTLAAQQVLMQFVAVAAFVLDGFAFTAESRVGQATGAGSRADMLRAIRLTGEFSAVTALALAIVIAAGGAWVAGLLTTNEQVRTIAADYLPYAALMPLLGVPAWMLDGIFIGATHGRALRDAAILSTLLYIGTDILLRPLGVQGVWLGLLAGYVFRAAALGWHLPRLLHTVKARA